MGIQFIGVSEVENYLNKENVKITVDDDTIPLKENNPKQYDDITAGDFLNQRLIELGLIK